MKRSPIKPTSPKRAAEIKGGAKMSGTFKIDVAAIRARQGAMGSKVADSLFGKAKGKDSQWEARKKAKAKADKWFSEWIRLRDADEHGMCFCVTSRKRVRKHWREMDCGHYISRAKESTRYDERNCHAQSKRANQYQGGHFLEHGLAIDRIHGPGTREALEKKAGQLCKRTTWDYEVLAKNYKERVDLIKATEPARYFKA